MEELNFVTKELPFHELELFDCHTNISTPTMLHISHKARTEGLKYHLLEFGTEIPYYPTPG